jgi:hypothetical protein
MWCFLFNFWHNQRPVSTICNFCIISYVAIRVFVINPIPTLFPFGRNTSEWLLFNATSTMSDCCLIFQLYDGENKLIINEVMMRSALYYSNMLSWIFIVLAHWNNSPRIDMSPYLDTLSWFRSNQSLFFLLNDACLAEKQQIPILFFGLTDQGSNPRSTTLEASTLTITPPMRLYTFEMSYFIHTLPEKTYVAYMIFYTLNLHIIL